MINKVVINSLLKNKKLKHNKSIKKIKGPVNTFKLCTVNNKII
jgi:hypothetical protein